VNFRLFVVIACLLGGLAMLVASEDAPPEHQKWMKDLGANLGALRKGVDVEQNATAMQATLKQIGAFWTKRNSEIAVNSCKETFQGASSVAKAAQSGDKEGISAGMKQIGAGCKGCHDQHREKVSDTLYRIK